MRHHFHQRIFNLIFMLAIAMAVADVVCIWSHLSTMLPDTTCNSCVYRNKITEQIWNWLRNKFAQKFEYIFANHLRVINLPNIIHFSHLSAPSTTFARIVHNSNWSLEKKKWTWSRMNKWTNVRIQRRRGASRHTQRDTQTPTQDLCQRFN